MLQNCYSNNRSMLISKLNFVSLIISFLFFSQVEINPCNDSYSLYLQPKKTKINIDANNAKAALLGELFKSDLYNSPLQNGKYQYDGDSIFFITTNQTESNMPGTLSINLPEIKLEVRLDDSGYYVNADSYKEKSFTLMEEDVKIKNLNCQKYVSEDGEVELQITDLIEGCEYKNYPFYFIPFGIPENKIVVSYRSGTNKWVLGIAEE